MFFDWHPSTNLRNRSSQLNPLLLRVPNGLRGRYYSSPSLFTWCTGAIEFRRRHECGDYGGGY